eukprot:1132062-Rhodomonas_salina.2
MHLSRSRSWPGWSSGRPASSVAMVRSHTSMRRLCISSVSGTCPQPPWPHPRAASSSSQSTTASRHSCCCT